MEQQKIKINKKILVSILLVFFIVLTSIILINISTKPSYKIQIEKFAKACSDEKKMDKFVEKYFDFQGAYALENSSASSMKEAYNNVKKSDYEDSNYINETKEFFYEFVSENVDIKEIGELKKFNSSNEIDYVDFVLTIDDKDKNIKFLFYKGKIVSVIVETNLKDMINTILP